MVEEEGDHALGENEPVQFEFRQQFLMHSEDLQQFRVEVEILKGKGGLVALLEVSIDQSEERLEDLDIRLG